MENIKTPRLPLSGKSIVVTRAAHQAEKLCGMIERAGGLARRFPALEISDPDDMAKLLDVIGRLAQFDLAIFISPNAVSKSASYLTAAPVPPNLQFAAIGRFTAEAMAESGFPANICPEEKFNSEGLLELPEMQDMADKRVVIFRGNEGRELLSDTLRARGAEVEYAEAYRRARPQTDACEFTQLLTRGEIDLITVTSSQALRGIFELAGAVGQRMLRKSAFLFGSRRILETASELGLDGAKHVADNPGDEAMFAAILAWTSRGKRQ